MRIIITIGMIIYLSGICDAGIFSVTYPGIGTFHISDFYDPVNRPIELLPRSPENIGLTFKLFTRRNHYTGQYIRINDYKSLYESNFNRSNPTKFIIHGYTFTPAFHEFMYQMRDNFLMLRDYNIIFGEWYADSFLPYPQAVADLRVMGRMVGILVEDLCRAFDVSEESFHLLGHSLGAHLMGYAGKYLNGKVGQITGFDPAGPYFQGVHNTSARLWHTDARFVDSIHTNAALLIPYIGFGMWETCSHVDIYVNGGENQVGCETGRVRKIFTEGLLKGVYFLLNCDHIRSTELYAEAILPTRSTPVAYLCEDQDKFESGDCLRCSEDSTGCVVVGPRLREQVKDPEYSIGKRYFMNTVGTAPFFRYQYVVNIKMLNDTKHFDGPHPVFKSIMLKFIGKDGNDQPIYFKRKVDFNQNYELSRVLVLDTDPDGLMDIEFRWSRFLDSIQTKMNVEHLKITALTYRSDEIKPPKTWIFYPVVKGIPNNEWVTFTRRDNLVPDNESTPTKDENENHHNHNHNHNHNHHHEHNYDHNHNHNDGHNDYHQNGHQNGHQNDHQNEYEQGHNVRPEINNDNDHQHNKELKPEKEREQEPKTEPDDNGENH